MPFAPVEKVRIRHHLGYLNVAASATFVLGAPAAVETSFIIETAMDKVLPEAESLARDLIGKCDYVEQQILENQEALVASKIGEIDLRDNELELLQKRYHYWRNGLANVLGVYPNPFDKRFQNKLNVPVHH